jgi:hypothetical protein
MVIKVINFKTRCVLYILVIGLCCLPGLAQNPTIPAQQGQRQEDEDARGFWYDGFQRKRPSTVLRKPSRYRRLTPRPTPAPSAPVAGPVKQEKTEDVIIGVTTWRLRQPATSSTERGDKPVVPTIERVESNTILSVSDQIFLTIEVPRTSYLYVINREQYSNGQFGEPSLIFPILRARNGDNKVEAGLLVRIPDERDSIPYFTLTSTTPELVAEDIAVLVTTQPLPNLQIGRKALTLPKELFAQWQTNWRAEAELFELDGEQNKQFTKAEQEASGDGERKLTQEDPLPQILYRVVAKPGSSIMINLPLRYSR